MSILIRSMRNVLRNPVRLILVVLLLGVSLMFVAAMVGLNTSAQQQLANVHKDLGTGITINFATNEAAGSSNSGNNSGNGNGGFGGFGGFGGNSQNNQTTTPIPDSTVTKVAGVPGVSGVEENLRRQDTDNILKTTSFTTPNGQSITIPPTVNGISNGATHFTLGTGSAPTVVSGRNFADSDATADVAMLSQSLAQTNKLQVGSTFTLKGTTFTIIGLYTTGDSRFADNSIIIPMTTMEKLYAVDGVDSITAYAATYDQVSSVATAIRTALGAQYDVVTQQTFVQDAIDAIDESQNSIQLAMIVSIVTAAVVIIFAVILLVRERTTEIGTLKALGASHWQVIRQFWSEVLTLSLLAAAMAVVLLVTVGPTVTRQFSSATRGGGGFGGRGGFGGGGGFGAAGALFSRGGGNNLSAATLTPQSLLIILGLGIGLALLTSVIPAWYVAHIKPAEVLRKGN